MCHSLPVSNSQVYSNDEFDLWPVYSGEWFRAFRPSCFFFFFLKKGTGLKTAGFRLSSKKYSGATAGSSFDFFQQLGTGSHHAFISGTLK